LLDCLSLSADGSLSDLLSPFGGTTAGAEGEEALRLGLGQGEELLAQGHAEGVPLLLEAVAAERRGAPGDERGLPVRGPPPDEGGDDPGQENEEVSLDDRDEYSDDEGHQNADAPSAACSSIVTV